MSPLRRITFVDQTATLIRESVETGRWKDRLPGLRKLSEEFGVSRQTLRLALARLVEEGVLNAGGGSEAHVIVKDRVKTSAAPRPLRVGILNMGPPRKEELGVMRFVSELAARLGGDGHHCLFAHIPEDRNPDMPLLLRRIVEKTGADVWMVNIGSKDVLQWFYDEKIPVLALGGRHVDLPIPAISYDPTENYRELVGKLRELGHERMVFIAPPSYHKPVPGKSLVSIIEILKANGIKPGPYHTPEFTPTPEGLEELMDSLFKITPPTALICINPEYGLGIISYLSRRGLRVPADVSVINSGEESSIGWLFPGLHVAHIDDSNDVCIRAIRRWVADFVSGRVDMRKQQISGPLIEGGTIGRAKR